MILAGQRLGIALLCIAWLCVACGRSGAQTVERSAGGATVQFPGPTGQIRQDPPDSNPLLLCWRQSAPTPQDSRRVLLLCQLRLAFWVNWLMRLAPDAIMDKIGDRFIADFRADAPDTKAQEPQWVQIGGHPGWQISFENRNLRWSAHAPDQQSPLVNRPYMSVVMLWTGESLVMAGVGGNQSATDDVFFRSLRTATTVKPGDPDAQWALLCKISGVVLLTLPLMLIGLVVVVDKAIQRRKRARRSAIS